MKTCQACGYRPAVVEFVQVTGNERREMSLCRECALSVGVRAQVEAFQRLSQLLMKQLGPASMPEEARAALLKTCGKCGLVFEQFVHTGLLGCPHCYVEFHDLLTPVLRRMHGVIKQTATRPSDTKPETSSAEVEAASREQLEMQLHLALLEEDYERAAKIRDQLRKF